MTVTGDGPALVMVHGWGQARQSMAPLADALRGRHRVINIDLPGHGAAKDLPGPYTFQRCMDSMAQAAQAGADGRFALLGWSMGGVIAAMYMLEGIEPRPHSLVLLAAPARFTAPGSAIGLGQSLAAIARLRGQMEEDHTAALRRFIEFFFISGEKIAPENMAPLRAALAPPEVFPPSRQALLSTLDQLAQSDLTAHKAAPMAARCLIINGALDKICPKGGQRLWEKVITCPTVMTLANCGHAPHLTRLEETSAAITNFLKGSI